MGLIASPDTRHYLLEDVYTHVTSVPDKKKVAAEELAPFEEHLVKLGDTINNGKVQVVIGSVNPDPPRGDEPKQEIDVAAGIMLTVISGDRTYTTQPVYMIRELREHHEDSRIDELGLKFRFVRIFPKTGELVIGMKDIPIQKDFIIMKAIVFPFINLLWLGSVIMVLGFIISIIRRVRQNTISAGN